MDQKTMGERIKEARIKLHLTQEQLAEKLSVSKQAVSNWECGKNFVDIEYHSDIYRILHVDLRDEYWDNSDCAISNVKTVDLKPLDDINSINELLSTIEALVDAVSEFQHVVKTMMELTVIQIIGYEIYLEKHIKKLYNEGCVFDWNCFIADLESVINDEDEWLLDRSKQTDYRSCLVRKLDTMAFEISAELFEDFNEKGFHNRFPQQIGRLAYYSSPKLMSLLPETNTDIMVTYKVALYDLRDVIWSSLKDTSEYSA